MADTQARDWAACFTGRRPKDLVGYRRESYVGFVDQMKGYINSLVARGCTRMYFGGAQGFDQLMFWAAVAVRAQNPQLRLAVYVPFVGQESVWLDEGLFSKKEYWQMLYVADSIIIVSDDVMVKGGNGKSLYQMAQLADKVTLHTASGPITGRDKVIAAFRRMEANNGRTPAARVLMKRNDMMVDDTFACIGLYPDESWRTAERGGTAACMQYALGRVNLLRIGYKTDGGVLTATGVWRELEGRCEYDSQL